MSSARPPVKKLTAAADAGAGGGLKAIVDRVTSRLSSVTAAAGRAYDRVAPLVSTAGDYVWFIGSSALLLTLPVLVEIQRETTIMVMQRQREAEMAQIQEQARMSNAGVLDQIKGMSQLLGGGGGGGEAR